MILFSAGFRPFFLLAGAYAALAMPLWLGVVLLGAPLPTELPPSLWHGHEMLFGFGGAVLAGFLLTALPNWTRTPPLAGTGLMLLALAWLAARAMALTGTAWPEAAFAVIDLAFLSALVLYAGTVLARTGNWRNFVVLAAILIVIAGNALFHAEALGVSEGTAATGLRLALNGFVLLIALIGGRIIPAFTARALDREGETTEIETPGWLDSAALLSVVAVVVADLIADGAFWAAAIALIAAVCNALRFLTWQSEKTLAMPIVWSLHLGYLWLVVGLFMKGLAATIPPLADLVWVHALTIGAVATMMMAVMTRAILGHTGRPLVVSTPVALAYGLLTVSAIARIASAAAGGAWFEVLLGVSGLCWTAAFGVFLVVYLPLLTGPALSDRSTSAGNTA